ncbi:hypothetical protein D3C72_1842900 [compost metagenome]
MAHGLYAPQRERQLVRIPATPLAPVGDHRFGRSLARLPRFAAGHLGRIEAIQVAAGRQRVGIAHRVAAGAGQQVAAGESGQQASVLRRGIEARIELPRALHVLALAWIAQFIERCAFGHIAPHHRIGRGLRELLVVDREQLFRLVREHAPEPVLAQHRHGRIEPQPFFL